MHAKSFQLCPYAIMLTLLDKCKSNARLPTFAIQIFWAQFLQKIVHLGQNTNNPIALCIYFLQIQASLNMTQLDSIYPFPANAP